MSPKAVAKSAETEPVVTGLQQKFWTAAKEIKAKLIERDDEIDIFLTALVCHEHACLQGPPGTGKSLLMDAVMSFVDGPRFFELMMKDLPADAVFGPVDIPSLLGKNSGQSEYVRLTKGYLPAAEVAGVDETFKAGPAVLNRFLKIMNERQFVNNGVIIQCPLISMFGASNEWPNPNEGGKELGALVDRFLFRKNIQPIQTKAGRDRLLWDRNHTPQLSVQVTRAELVQARKEAMALQWTDKAKDTLTKILGELKKIGIVPGDRRQYKSVDAASAAAYIAGDTKVLPEHLEILQHVLWDDPVEQPEKAGQIIRKLANPHGAEINGLLMEFQTLVDTTDLTDLKQMAAVSPKLKEIKTKLEGMKETPKQKAAMELLEGRMEDIRRAAMKKML